MNSKPANQPGTTFLTGKQAAEILEKLKVIKNIEGQTIKIQTVQTNPQTGMKKIVAIPIQSAPSTAAGSSNLSVSPMKTLKTSYSPVLTQGRTIKINSPRTASFSNVSLVRTTPSISGLPVSLQQHSTPQVDTLTGVQKLATHSNVSEKNSNIIHGNGSHQTVMSQQRVTLTPQKSVLSASNVAGSTNLSSVRVATSNNFQSVSDRSLELGEYVSTKRQLEIDNAENNDAKRRKTEKGGKGLRHFSMKVCEKVKAKGTTTYNEVADELVAELTDPRYQSPSDPTYDQKNIRRRVYDALNVLMAMNIISKEKKEIHWLGLPTNSIQEVSSHESDKLERLSRIKQKTKQLQDLILQQIAFKNLVERNRETERLFGAPTPNSAIQLPFIIVGTSKRTVIDCSISNDKMEYLFNFDNTFEIHDDMEVLKKMKMTMGLENGTISSEDLRLAKNMVPKALQSNVEEMAKQGTSDESLVPRVKKPVIKTEIDPISAFEGIEEGLDEDSDD